MTTKIRKGDWKSVEKAIRQLSSSKLGPSATPSFNGITSTNNINISNYQIQNFAVHKVADEAARLALDLVTGKLVYQIDNGYLYLGTTN